MEGFVRRLCRFVIGVYVVVGLSCVAPGAFAQDGVNRPPGAVDGRGYELVSQADKDGNQVVDGIVPAVGSDRVLYSVHGGVAGTSGGDQPLLIAERGSSGWVTHSAMPPRDQMYANHYYAVANTPDLSGILAGVFDGLAGPNYATNESLVQLDGDGGQALLHTFPTFEGLGYVSPLVSDDLGHIYINVTERIDPSHVAGTSNVYDFGVTPPQLVSTMPGTGQAPACGVPEAGSAPGFSPTGVSQHQVSADGRYVFFGSQGNNCSGPTELYVNDRATGQTALVSGPPVGGASDLGISEFVSATPDGSEAFYLTATTLDPVDSADRSDADLDVYRYDTATGVNTCVTCATANADVTTPSSVHPAGVSGDGSHVYFVSEQQLLPGAVAGAENVYVVRGGTLGFVGITTVNGGVESVAAGPSGSEISRDGRFLVFASNRPEMDAISGAGNGGRLQYYRYDDVSRTVTCVSCPPGGAATGDAYPGRLDGARDVRPDLHGMTADGSTVLFVSPDKLVPEDVNGGADIYEWHDGTVGLITDGVTRRISDTVPQILDVSPDGRDVFFQDVARLTWDAQDDATKIYDARIGGGFAPPPAPPAPCASLDCHGQPSPPPLLSDAASAHASSSGNVRPTTPVFVVSRITASQRKQLAQRGTLVLDVRVGRAGRVSVIGQARIGSRIVQVASVAKTAHRPGTLRLTIRLSQTARRRLVASHRLTVVLGVEYTQRSVLRRIVLHLTAPTRHGR